MEIDFWEQSPEDAGALFPAIQDIQGCPPHS